MLVKNQKGLIPFDSIPRYMTTRYSVDVNLGFIEKWIDDNEKDPDLRLELDPDFQRGHVWTREQQDRYMEHLMRGGISGRDIYFNSPEYTWTKQDHCDYPKMVCVDGLQRITAVRGFLKGEVSPFGHYIHEFEDNIARSHRISLHVHVNDLQTRKEVLEWYLQLNSGGTVHTQEELDRVRGLLVNA